MLSIGNLGRVLFCRNLILSVEHSVCHRCDVVAVTVYIVAEILFSLMMLNTSHAYYLLEIIVWIILKEYFSVSFMELYFFSPLTSYMNNLKFLDDCLFDAIYNRAMHTCVVQFAIVCWKGKQGWSVLYVICNLKPGVLDC